jgi:iron complex transport system substrate-binding protein
MTPAALIPPSPVDDGTRRDLLAAGLALALGTAACGSDERDDAGGGSRTRSVRHALGTARVPVQPQRVAAINVIAADPVLALDVPAVALVDFLPEVLQGPARRVPLRIDTESVDLEALAAARPDVILTGAFEGEIFADVSYERLARIAPTVAFAFTSDYAWREYFTFFADILGRGAPARRRLAALDARIAGLAAALDDRRTTSASVVQYTAGGELEYYRTDSGFASEILDRIGFARPDVPERLLTDTEVSAERLLDVDADLIFVFGGDKEQDARAFAREPLADRLRGRILPVGQHWFGFGLLAAEAVVDDVERLLVS